MRWFGSLAGWFAPREFTATICDHTTRRTGTVTAFGETVTTTMPRNATGSTDYCLDCIAAMTVRCAWCGGPIFVGDAITLYTPQSDKDFERVPSAQLDLPFVFDKELGCMVPAHVVVYQRKPLQLVGCMRWRCADSATDRAGFWVSGKDGRGEVHRVRTAYEELINAERGFVVVGDISDPRQATPLKATDRPLSAVRDTR